jgi:urease accessory protein
MIRAVAHLPAEQSRGAFDAEVWLDFESRHRRRIMMRIENGLEFLLDLPSAVHLKDRDALVLEDGRRIRVRASPEPLAEISCRTMLDLMRITWHLGNRHLPAAIRPDCVLIRRDEVIEAMAAGFGATVRHVHVPFDPESGAYAGHGHQHTHDRDTHDHRHD